MSDNQQPVHAATMADTRATATHLVVFQHGLLGSEADFANVELLFRRHLANESVYAHTASCNATSFANLSATCDGIDCGAERLATEIVRLAATMPQLQKFSIVGHSMGGLYARYCIGILYARGFFAKIEPVNFITLATPHLGNRRPQRGSVNMLYNAIAPRLFDRTGRQFALADEASEQTIALSKKAPNKYPHRPSFAACQELDGELPVCFERTAVEAVESSAFLVRSCVLKDHALSFYEAIPKPEEAPPLPIASIDLQQADVTLILPDKESSVSSSKTESSDWFIIINQPDSSTSLKETVVASCTLRLASSQLQSLWKWVAALSNSAYGLHCVTRGSSQAQAQVQAATQSAPSLLSCLARGQFLQALQLFQVRTLYGTVFNDHTVPYSCASIRTFNPYRLLETEEPSALVTSPFYDHIVQRSLWQAPLVRDTLPLDAKVTATRKSTAKFLLGKEQSSRSIIERQASETSTGHAEEVRTSTSSSGSLLASATSSFMSYFTSASPSPKPDESAVPVAARSPPFTESHLLLDRVDDAFPTDDARDTLRAMLVSMQSVAWRRLDVSIDSLLAHEIIIAKRADATDGLTANGGLDIVHHMIDSFVL